MSTDRTPEGSLPNKIIIADASNETIDVPGFVTPFAVVSGRDDDDGTPRVKRTDHAFMDPPQVRVHDLQRKTPAGIPDRRVSFQVVNDFGAEYADAGPDESPYGQVDPFTAQNRTTRVTDGDGAVALFSSLERNVGSEDGRFARALTCLEFDGGPRSPKDKAPPDPPLPDGVTIEGDTVTVGGSAGNISITNPAAVEAAKEANRQGGTAQEIFAWALAAEQGRDPPPIKGERSLARAKEEPPPPPPAQAPADKPGGYVTGDGFKVGQLGTFFAPGSGEPIHEGSRGEAIGTLPMRWDGQLALDQERRGPLWIKDEDAAKVQELKAGILVKGYLAPDTSLKDQVGHLPGNTHALAVLIRIPAPIPGDGPPEPPPPEPPPPEPPPPFINLLPNGGSFTPIPNETVVIPSPTGDGSKWIGTHGPNNELLWRKVLANGTVVGGYQVDPDGTQTQIDGNGSNTHGFISSPNGYAPPTASAEDAAALAAAKDRTVIYVDEDTGVLSSVDPDGNVTALGSGDAPVTSTPYGGTGALGAVTVSADTDASGIKNYASLTVDAGSGLRATAGEKLHIKATGNVTINGVTSATGRGPAGTAGTAGTAGVLTGTSSVPTTPTAPSATATCSASGGSGGGGSGGARGISSGNGAAGVAGAARSYPNSGAGGTAGSAGGGVTNTTGSAGGNGGNAAATAALQIDLSDGAEVAGAPGAGGGGGSGGATDDSVGGTVGAGGAGGSAGSQAGTGTGAGGNGTAGESEGAPGGASGGGGGGAGGAGGGRLEIEARGDVTIDAAGELTADGGPGGDGGDGGTSNTNGGAGGGAGGGGGGGGGGQIRVRYGGTFTAGGTFSASAGAPGGGGSGGAGDGGANGGNGGDAGASADGQAGSEDVG